MIEGGDGCHLTLAWLRGPLELWVFQLLRSVLQAAGEAILMLLLPEGRILRSDCQKLHGEAEDHQDYQNSCQVKGLRGRLSLLDSISLNLSYHILPYLEPEEVDSDFDYPKDTSHEYIE